MTTNLPRALSTALFCAILPLAAQDPPKSNGSLFVAHGQLADLSADLRARHVNDVVTILISDKATALSRGNSKTSRESSAGASIAALGGPTRAAGPLSALLGLESSRAMNGAGETSRSSALYTTLTAKVVEGLPNGLLAIEGTKAVTINSERQLVRIKGFIRSNDIDAANRVLSDRIADLRIEMEGKGLVSDATRRPGFLYRLLLGILPF